MLTANILITTQRGLQSAFKDDGVLASQFL